MIPNSNLLPTRSGNPKVSRTLTTCALASSDLQFLKNPRKYRSVSAFAPITNPSNCPWGQKAFGGYFGEENKGKWAEHDATELVRRWEGPPLDVLIDVVGSPSVFSSVHPPNKLLLSLFLHFSLFPPIN